MCNLKLQTSYLRRAERKVKFIKVFMIGYLSFTMCVNLPRSNFDSMLAKVSQVFKAFLAKLSRSVLTFFVSYRSWY